MPRPTMRFLSSDSTHTLARSVICTVYDCAVNTVDIRRLGMPGADTGIGRQFQLSGIAMPSRDAPMMKRAPDNGEMNWVSKCR